jgi:hypothetical protein
MKISEHLKAHREFKSSLERLSVDVFGHRRTIVEVCVIAAANLTNAVLHLTGHVLEDRDIKHQHLYGLLKREAPVKEANELGSCHNELEQLKYSVTHGVERDGGLARKALELLEKVEMITLRYLQR